MKITFKQNKQNIVNVYVDGKISIYKIVVGIRLVVWQTLGDQYKKIVGLAKDLDAAKTLIEEDLSK